MIESKYIIGLVVALGVMVFIGVVLIDSLDTVGERSATTSESFTVDDSSTDKTCTLGYDPYDASAVQVEYYNGTAWKTLTVTTDYVLTGQTLVVNATAMY